MLNLNLIVIGKLKENYWQEAENEYIKRLGRYVKLKITELTEEPMPQQLIMKKSKSKKRKE